ncbi:MAG: hypothetical protein DRJ10_01465 [Bacteroidetes bacterium]|nr:MAG: hypothetical protein DRJ10_01465 [Bacteroidota bacterium]
MNYNGQYLSSISKKITFACFFSSFIFGILFFPDTSMIFIFVLTITLVGNNYGQELLLLFAREDLKLEIQIGNVGLAYLKLAINIFKANGEITENELVKVENYMNSEFGKEIGLASRNFVKKHRFKDYELKNICRNLSNLGHTHKLQFIYQLFALAFVDKELNKKEEQIILHVVKELKINILHYKNIKSMYLKSRKKQSYNSDGSSYKSQNNNRILKNFFSGASFAYLELEVSPNISNHELKTVYRDLAKKYHPDKWVNKQITEHKKAKEKFQRINNAYELIKKVRNLK